VTKKGGSKNKTKRGKSGGVKEVIDKERRGNLYLKKQKKNKGREENEHEGGGGGGWEFDSDTWIIQQLLLN